MRFRTSACWGLVLFLAAAASCGPRRVAVGTAAAEPGVSLQVTNRLNQAVNVYVTSGGTDMFVRQVPANSTMQLPVHGVRAGATGTLRAVTVDGSRTYSRANVLLSGTLTFPVP